VVTTNYTVLCRWILSLFSASYWDSWLSCVIGHDPELSYPLQVFIHLFYPFAGCYEIAPLRAPSNK